MTRILITGGAGFIGHHLARRLLEDEAAELTLVDNFSRGRHDAELADMAAGRVRLIDGDLTTPETWTALGRGYDFVYHLAAVIGVRNVLQRPQDVVRVNALATIHLLDWLVGGGADKVLFSSTSEAYAWTQHFYPLPVPTPESVPLALTDLSDARSSYAGSKIFGELAVTQYCLAHQKRFVIVRYHNVYGPRMGTEHVIPELFQRARAGQNPLVVYSADHKRAFCYVTDAVEATVQAMDSPAADGYTINIGNDREETTIGDLAVSILEHARCSVEIIAKPADNDPIPRRCPDLTRARQLLGYEPSVTLDNGLRATLAWYEPRLAACDPAPAR